MGVPNYILVGILIFAVISWVVMIWGQCRKQPPKYEATSLLVAASLIACSISFISLWFSLPILKDADGMPNYDHQDVIVGILSLLVTLLLGWNIFQLIDFEGKTKVLKVKYDELETKQIEYDNQMSKHKANLYEAIADIYNHTLVGESSVGNRMYIQYIMHVLNSIVIRSRLGDFPKCTSIIDTFLADENLFENFSPNEDDMAEIVRLFNIIEGRNEIANFERLADFISTIRNR